MPTLLELKEQRANLWARMQEIRSQVDTDGWTAELRANWDAADADLVARTGDIDREERAAALTSRYNEIDDQTVDTRGGPASAGAVDAYRAAYEAWLRHGIGGVDTDQRQLLEANYRALQTDTGGAGGYTVPEGFWAKVTETMKYFGGVRQVAEVITTTAGNPLPWPTNDDTSNTGEILEEGVPVAEGDVAFGQKSLAAFTASSKMVRVSNLLLQDTGIDLEAFLGRRIGERIGRIQNTRLTTGSGASNPQGLITGATTGKNTNSATAIIYDELIDLQHSVDVAYRDPNRCQWMMHDLILAYVRKIRDDSGGAGVGRPVWEPSVQVGQPDRLLGFRYTINNDMASTVATKNKTMAFGDFGAGYVVRTVAGGTMSRLTERYAEYLQTAFFGYERFDGLVQDASAYKLLVQA